jgi:hypothetical protein
MCENQNKIIDQEYIRLVEQQLSCLNDFYHSSRLRHSLKTLEYSISFPALVDEKKRKDILYHLTLAGKKHSRNPLVRIYLKAIHIYLKSSRGTETHQETNELLEEIKMTMAILNSKEIRGILFSLCALKTKASLMNPDQYKSLIDECFAIYKYMVESAMLVKEDRGIMHPGFFLSIMAMAIMTNHHDWAENFIQAHEKYLPASDRDNLMLYARGILFNAKGDYKKSVSQLLQVKYVSVNVYVNTKVIMLMNHYETGSFEDFSNVINSYNAYVYKYPKKISVSSQAFVKDLIQYTQKLFEFKSGKSMRPGEFAARVSPLISEIREKVQNMGTREWLVKKAMELAT